MKNTDTNLFSEAIQLEHSGTTKRTFVFQNEGDKEKSDAGHQENEEDDYALFI